MARPNELQGMPPLPAINQNRILESGEKILWSGKPVFSRYMRSGPWYLIPFSIMWCGFAIFWEAGVLASGGPLFADLWGIPFVLIGLYMVFGRYYVLARQARKALYVVTDRRVLIVGSAFRTRIIEMRLGSLPPVLVDQDLSGIGTITFGQPTPNTPWRRTGFPAGTSDDDVPSFVAIERPSEVARLIEQARGGTHANQTPESIW